MLPLIEQRRNNSVARQLNKLRQRRLSQSNVGELTTNASMFRNTTMNTIDPISAK